MTDPVRRRRVVLCACLVAALAASALNRSLSLSLLEAWAASSLTLALLALAAAIVISCGRIDISSGAAMSSVGMIIVSVAGYSGMSAGGVLAGHLVGAAYLAALYSLYHFATRAGVPSIIATLAGLMISKGVSIIIQTCSLGVGEICRASAGLSRTTLSVPPALASVLDGLPFNLGCAALVVGTLAWWRYWSPGGLRHIATGMDEASAGFARIPVDRVRGVAFGIAAALLFVATLLRLHGENNGGWAPNTGWGEELIAIAIAVVGGTRVSGGHFDPVNVLLAGVVVFIGRDIIVNDLGVPTEATSLLFGLLLIAISVADLRSRPGRGS